MEDKYLCGKCHNFFNVECEFGNENKVETVASRCLIYEAPFRVGHLSQGIHGGIPRVIKCSRFKPREELDGGRSS